MASNKTKKKTTGEKYDYIRNLPPQFRNGGDFGGRRPRLTDEEKQIREQEKIAQKELNRIALQQRYDFAKIYDELSKSGDIKLMMLQLISRSVENGNPSVMKFIAEILGNMSDKKEKPQTFEIKIAREL